MEIGGSADDGSLPTPLIIRTSRAPAMISLLDSQEEIKSARAMLRSEGLNFAQHGRLRLWDILYRVRYRVPMPKPDPIKSWDVMNTLQIVEREIPDRPAGILDMGCYNSEILYALHRRGYRNLHGCDLNPMCRRMAFWHAVRYRQAAEEGTSRRCALNGGAIQLAKADTEAPRPLRIRAGWTMTCGLL